MVGETAIIEFQIEAMIEALKVCVILLVAVIAGGAIVKRVRK